MHQFASSLLSFFLSPLHWIFFLLVAACFFRSRLIKRTCIVVAIVVFCLFGNEWLLNWYAAKWQPEPVAIPSEIVYSCGIVPGGFASPDEDGNGRFNSSADRFIQALKLYKQGHITHIAVSGGNGKQELNTFREGEWVKRELVVMGVPDSAILVEDQSNNTMENASNTRKLLDSNQLKPPFLLITSAHHLPRAMAVFKKAGVPVLPFPCNYIAGRGINTFSSILPDVSVLQTWDIYLKETAGYFWYR